MTEKKTTELDLVDSLGVEDELVANVSIDGVLKTKRINASKVAGLGRTRFNIISAPGVPGILQLDEREHLGAIFNINNTEDACRIDLPDYGDFDTFGLICMARVANGANPVSVRALSSGQLRAPQHSAIAFGGDEVFIGPATSDADEHIFFIIRTGFSWTVYDPFGVRQNVDDINRLGGGGGPGGAVDSVVGLTGDVSTADIIAAITTNLGSDDWLGPDAEDRRYQTGGGKTGSFSFVAADETGTRWINWQGALATDTATLDVAAISSGGVLEGERNSVENGVLTLTGGLTSTDSLTITAGARFSLVRPPGTTRIRVSQG